ncbi:SUMF1/EgtB/PvdO family nonheme iron enzyme [Candidatus Omnitrophota bacterium]
MIILSGLILIVTVTLKMNQAYANNLNISNVSLKNQNASAGTILVEFDISWNNSWRNAINHDAAWVFVKYKDSDGDWNHATLKTAGTNPTGFSRGATGTTISIDVPDLTGSSKVGCWIKRTNSGYGTVSTTDIQLVWDYNTDGLSETDTIDEVQVIGYEMVYIPQGDFELGDVDGFNGESTNALHITDSVPEGQATISETIETDITVDTNGWDDSTIEDTWLGIDGDGGIDWTDDDVPDNANFPTGWKDFYIMKYEITQGQYSKFLNLVPATQQSARYPSGYYGTNRYTIDTDYSVDRPDRANNWMDWMDLAAFCDWSALRPMTGLELEKAGRGPTAAVRQEYAWGTTNINGALADEISASPEDGTETITDADANACYGNITFTSGDSGLGPLRVGIFAESATNRSTSGASYYGVMELSGNVWEIVVTVGADSGRNYSGEGDGVITSTVTCAGADESTWPGYWTLFDELPCQAVVAAGGSGRRGGPYAGTTNLRLSDRAAGAKPMSSRNQTQGGRCVRSYTGY